MSNKLMVNQQATLKNYLEKGKKSLAAMIGNEKGAERLIRLALVANAKIPKIRECTQESLLRSLIECAQLNLEPFTALQQCYIIPYDDRKKGITEAQFMLGYRGIVTMAARADISLDAHVVYEHDEFECVLGTEKKLKHIPNWRDERGEMLAVYAVAQYKSGIIKFDIMSKSDVDKIRKRSKSPNNGPWVTDYEEMAKKTVVRRLAKYLDMNPEVKRAIEKDAATDTIDVDFDFIDIDTAEIEMPTAGDAVPSAQAIEAETNLKEYRDKLYHEIKGSGLDQNLKADLLAKLVQVKTKSDIDGLISVFMLHSSPKG